MFERSGELLNNCFNEYEYKCVFDGENLKRECNLLDFPIVFLNNKLYYPLTKTEKLNINYKMCSYADFPIKKGKEICKIDIFNQNKLLFSEKIYTINSIKSKKTFELIKNRITNYFSENYENK